ncbi:hypothetical protein ID866_3111 [Astraeus odoratus]|nr:hypothetical protein ID866_3111 [Astraeus odoratus]
MGKSSSGVYLESNWLKNTDDGTQTGGVGAGYNLEVGPVMLNAGAKAIYIGPKKGDNGVAFPIGGGVNVALTDSIHVYGEGYAAPEGLNNSVKNYVEANGGYKWVKPGVSDAEMNKKLTECEAQALIDLPPDNVVTGSSSEKTDKKNKKKDISTSYTVEDANEYRRDTLVDSCMFKSGWDKIEVQ